MRKRKHSIGNRRRREGSGGRSTKQKLKKIKNTKAAAEMRVLREDKSLTLRVLVVSNDQSRSCQNKIC